eukprot:4314104-Prymnesium_polylepis.1
MGRTHLRHVHAGVRAARDCEGGGGGARGRRRASCEGGTRGWTREAELPALPQAAVLERALQHGHSTPAARARGREGGARLRRWRAAAREARERRVQ